MLAGAGVLAALALHREQVVARQGVEQAARATAVRVHVVQVTVGAVAAVPGQPVQDGHVDVLLRNDGPEPVRLLDSQLDGGGPVTAAGAVLVPGGLGVLPSTWQVLCAEVGGLVGPRTLAVRLVLGDGTVVTSVVDLAPQDVPAGPARAYRSAAVRSCTAGS